MWQSRPPSPSSSGSRERRSSYDELESCSVLEMALSDSESPTYDYEDERQDFLPPPLAYSRSSSSSSSSYDSGSGPAAAPSASRPSFTQRLRQRVSNVLHAGQPQSFSSPRLAPSPDSRLSFLMGAHRFEQTIPFPPGPSPVRKRSDFDRDLAYKPNNKTELMDSKAPSPGTGASAPAVHASRAAHEVFALRTREQIVLHFLMELAMLRRDAAVLVFGLLFQWVHSIATNFAYYYHAQLTAAERVPLKDVFFETLPSLNGSWWAASEYLVYGMIVTVAILIASILVVRWNAPHGRPLYCIPILRRAFFTLVAAQCLRIVSFMITTLPGASRQCVYDVPQDMTRDEMLTGPAHERGNPQGWMPPTTTSDILWRVDATNGCGDLMFSSHTIFTVLFICIVFRYFNWNILKYSMVCTQIFAIPFILAARKHYSIDVFTALYVTPLLFQFIKTRMPDMDVSSVNMGIHYGIRFYRGLSGAYVVQVFGNEFYIAAADLPLDLQKLEREDSIEKHAIGQSEVEPMIV